MDDDQRRIGIRNTVLVVPTCDQSQVGKKRRGRNEVKGLRVWEGIEHAERF